MQIILLNILIALYNSAYSDIYENADDEYLALFAQRTMQFVRAPDENVYIAPFNLIEMVISGLFEWWMNKKTYEFINDCVMAVIYAPLLFVSAFFETRTAHSIRRNRAAGEEDDDQVHAWEQLSHQMDFESDGWSKTCEDVKPNVEEEPAVVEVRKLRAEVDSLKALLQEINKAIAPQVKGSGQADLLTSQGAETVSKDESVPARKTDPEVSYAKAVQKDVPESSQEEDGSDKSQPIDDQDASGAGGKAKKKNKQGKGGASSGGGPSAS